MLTLVKLQVRSHRVDGNTDTIAVNPEKITHITPPYGKHILTQIFLQDEASYEVLGSFDEVCERLAPYKVQQ
jgi:hypothetical protein